jgi:preprotein translocase subunit SecG
MNWIGIVTTLLTVVNILVCLLLIFVVLLQRPKNEGLGAAFGGETASNIFGAQTTNVLANITRWLGGLFLGLCFVIAILGTVNPERKSISAAFVQQRADEKRAAEAQKQAEEAAKEAAAKATAPAVPIETPKAVTPGVQAPGAAPAPGTPEVPKPGATNPPATPATPGIPTEGAAKPVSPAETPAPAATNPSAKPAEAQKPAEPAPAPAPEPKAQ